MINWLKKFFSKKPPQIDYRIKLLEKYPYSLKTINQIYDATGKNGLFNQFHINNRWQLVELALIIANIFNKDPMVALDNVYRRLFKLKLGKGEIENENV